jgi:hypothetical protein
MITKIKAIGLALLAFAAMSMVAASAAQAEAGEVHISAGKSADITGEQEGVGDVFLLTKSGAETVCTQAHFEGTAEGQVVGQTTAKELTLTGRYTGCEVKKPLELGAATVDMNGCKYTLTQAFSGGVPLPETANVDIAGCTAGKQIQITTAVGCTIDVPEQSGTGGAGLVHITLTNVSGGAKKELTPHVTVQGINYEFTGIFCPGQINVITTDGDYNGTETFKGFADTGLTTQVTHNGHQYKKLTVGSQVDLFAT